MGDSFYEQLVAKKPRFTDTLIRILMIVAVVAVTYISLLLIGPFFLFALIGMVLLTVYIVFPRLKVEYEYSLLNHYLDVSVIYNMSKRKKKAEIDIQKAEIIAPTGSPRLNSFRPVKVQDFSSGDSNVKSFSIMITMDQKLNQFIIEPDEKMLQLMKGWMGQKMYLD